MNILVMIVSCLISKKIDVLALLILPNLSTHMCVWAKSDSIGGIRINIAPMLPIEPDSADSKSSDLLDDYELARQILGL
jgi:hypothetical protein